MKLDTRKLTSIAMLSALAFIVMMVMRIPISPLPFLKYDPKDIIIVIAGFIYSPIVAVAISVIVSLIEMITVSDTVFIGFIMNVLSTCAFVVPATIIYKKHKSLKSAIVGLGIGVIAMTIIMMLWNYLLTPLYMKIPREDVIAMLVPMILPFNLIKGGLNMAITLIIYKPVVTALRKARLIPSDQTNTQGKKVNWIVIIVALVAIATMALIVLSMKGII
ncbi:MAG: ECF transporter S component [Clostridia bacterium]